MSGTEEVPNVKRPSLPDAAESPEESGVKKLFHDNHTSDLKISTPENLQDCIQQEALNLSQSKRNLKVDIRKLRLTTEQKETIHNLHMNIHMKKSDQDKNNLLECLSDQGLITTHRESQESEHVEMPEVVVDDADVDPGIELITNGGT